MSWVLVVQPDAVQADALLGILRAHASADVMVADSLEAALSSIDERLPDLILLPPLMPPDVEDYLIAYLSTHPGAGHVQILGIPRLERADDTIVQPPHRSLFPWQRRQAPRVLRAPGCDPDVFTQDVVAYLSSAEALKQEAVLAGVCEVLNDGPERRRDVRFANDEVPWISFVRFGGERAALINVSSRGALLRTHARPAHHFLRRADPHVRRRPRLTLELGSHSAVHAIGRVIRCIPLRASAGMQYEIAFSFDDSVALHLPSTGGLVPVLADPATALTGTSLATRRAPETPAGTAR